MDPALIGFEIGSRERAAREDERRQAQLQNIANAGLSPEQQRDAIQQLYAKDPSALKRHVENLFGRLVGRKPQPVSPAYASQSVTTQAAPLKVGNETLPAPAPVTVNYPGAKTHAERLAQDLSGGKTKEQQALDLFNQERAAQEEQASGLLQAKAEAVRKILADPKLNDEDKQYLVGLYGAHTTRPTTDEMKRQDYESLLLSGQVPKDTNGNPLSYEAWVAYSSAQGRSKGAPPKPMSPGSQYMQALVKKNSGQTLTPEDEAALKSYPEYIRQTSVIPGIARGQAYAEFRPMTVINPENPSQTMVVTAGQAEKNGYATPQSISYVMDSAGHKAMIPRNLGQNLASLQTAEDHLQMMSQMISSLGNGNVPLFNSMAQRWAQATGDPTPTNFDTLKTSLEGEMARAYTGVGATTQEIAAIGEEISRSNSPAQLAGVLATAKAAMNRRRVNLWAMVNAATNVPLKGGKGPAPKKRSGAQQNVIVVTPEDMK